MMNINEFFMVINYIVDFKKTELNYISRRVLFYIYQLAHLTNTKNELNPKVTISFQNFSDTYKIPKSTLPFIFKELCENKFILTKQYHRNFKKIKGGYETNTGNTYYIDLHYYDNYFSLISNKNKLVSDFNFIKKFTENETDILNGIAKGKDKKQLIKEIYNLYAETSNKNTVFLGLIIKIKMLSEEEYERLQHILPYYSANSID